MKIGIDGRIIFRRGVGRYIANLVKNLLDIDKENTYFIYLDNNSILKDYLQAKNCIFRRLATSNAFYYMQLLLPQAAARDGLDVLHCTDNTLPYMFDHFKGKKIVTIHDTMYVRPLAKAILKPTAKQRLVDIYNKISIPASGRLAAHVITVSEYSKKDIIKNIRISPDKINVIKHGSDERYQQVKDEAAKEKMKKKYGIDRPYVLMSAASDLRKNSVRAIEAFNIFNAAAGDEYALVITSIGEKELSTTNINDRIKELKMEKQVIITGYVPDEEMALIYNCAFMFLFPSTWEGFGLQVLEAFACGTPVVTAGNSSLPEVAGDAAMFVDPFSTGDIVRGMTEIEKNQAMREELVRKGYERLKEFSWKKTAEETLAIYKAAAVRS